MVQISWRALLLGGLVLLPTAAVTQGLPTPKDASLYIISPKDGATISGPFWCVFGLRGMGITHAGDQFPNSGHHHLLIDVDEPLNPNEPIPQTRNISTTVQDKRKGLSNYHPASIRFSWFLVMQNISRSIHLCCRRKLPLLSKSQAQRRKWLRRRYRGAGRSRSSVDRRRSGKPNPSVPNDAQ